MFFSLICAFILSILFIYFLIHFSHRLGIIDEPNDRSVHKKATPRSAGVGFVSAALISLLIFNYDHFIDFFYVYVSIAIVMGLGIHDDKHNVPPKIKLLVLFIVSYILYSYDIKIDSLGVYFGFEVNLHHIIVFPFTALAIVGFTNALNLTDGLDGLAGGLSLIILMTFLTIGLVNDDVLMINLSAIFIVVIVVFLFFNWNPAKIFMGDSGSLSLGLIISILSIKSLDYIMPVAVLFIIALPLIDTFIVMRRRRQRGQSLFIADKNHLHHIIYKMKVNVRFTVTMLLCIQLSFSIIGYQITQSNQVLSLVLFGILFFIFLNLFDQRLKRRKKKSKLLKKDKRLNQNE